MGVHQFVFPGVITLADGEFEAVLLYLYIKGLREAHAVNFRGFLFAQSAERAWYNWGETGLCQPYVAKGLAAARLAAVRPQLSQGVVLQSSVPHRFTMGGCCSADKSGAEQQACCRQGGVEA